jgi:hypothetical protein
MLEDGGEVEIPFGIARWTHRLFSRPKRRKWRIVRLECGERLQMAERMEAQVLASQGQSLVAHVINSSGDWIACAQDEDFGVDMRRS